MSATPSTGRLRLEASLVYTAKQTKNVLFRRNVTLNTPRSKLRYYLTQQDSQIKLLSV